MVQSAASQASWIPTPATLTCPMNSIPSRERTAVDLCAAILRCRSAALPWTPSMVQSAASEASWIPTPATLTCPMNSIPSRGKTADLRRPCSLAVCRPAAMVLGWPTESLFVSATRLLDQRHSHSDDYEEAWSSAAASALTPGRPLCSLALRDGRLYSIDVGRASNDRKDTDLQSK